MQPRDDGGWRDAGLRHYRDLREGVLVGSAAAVGVSVAVAALAVARGWDLPAWAVAALAVVAVAGVATAAALLAVPGLMLVPPAWEIRRDAEMALIAAGMADQRDEDGLPSVDVDMRVRRYPRRRLAVIELRVRSAFAVYEAMSRAFDDSACAFRGADCLMLTERGRGLWEVMVWWDMPVDETGGREC